MKFFLDENVNVGCLKPLEALYGDHEFRHAYSEGLGGTKDVPLLNTLQQQGYDATSQRTGRSFATRKSGARSSTPGCTGSATWTRASRDCAV